MLERAKAVEASFRVDLGLYLIGSLERGLTVYNQQLRAHNLVWSLWELSKRRRKRNDIKIRRVAIVGGGIAGLTTAACFLSLFKEASVTVFEQLSGSMPASARLRQSVASSKDLRLARPWQQGTGRHPCRSSTGPKGGRLMLREQSLASSVSSSKLSINLGIASPSCSGCDTFV